MTSVFFLLTFAPQSCCDHSLPFDENYISASCWSLCFLQIRLPCSASLLSLPPTFSLTFYSPPVTILNMICILFPSSHSLTICLLIFFFLLGRFTSPSTPSPSSFYFVLPEFASSDAAIFPNALVDSANDDTARFSISELFFNGLCYGLKHWAINGVIDQGFVSFPCIMLHCRVFLNLNWLIMGLFHCIVSFGWFSLLFYIGFPCIILYLVVFLIHH